MFFMWINQFSDHFYIFNTTLIFYIFLKNLEKRYKRSLKKNFKSSTRKILAFLKIMSSEIYYCSYLFGSISISAYEFPVSKIWPWSPFSWAAVVLLFCIGYAAGEIQLLQCIATEEEPDSCYILTPIYLKPLDILTFLNPEKLKNVTHFELKAFTNLQTIPNVILDTFPQLEELVLGGFSFINTLTFTDFAHAANLRTLDLKANELTTIPYSVFSLATNLENLDLSFNMISTIEDLAFNGLAQLQKLDLSYNKISTLTHFSFSGIQNLKYIDLSHNKIKLLENAALYLPSLTHLYLGSNDFKLLPDGLFGIGPTLTSALTVVDLSENKLTHIGQSIYNLKQLTWLNLTSNKNIDDLNLNGFAAMENLEELYLSNTGKLPFFIQIKLLSKTFFLKYIFENRFCSSRNSSDHFGWSSSSRTN